MKRLTMAWLLAVGCWLTSVRQVWAELPQAIDRRPQVQVALLLDTSNSMDGLIEQAKAELWKVVNSLNSARQNGIAPEFHVALYEYGNNGLSAESGHIRCVVPLSNDLDRISEALFSLRTNGGNEFCGQVIERAVTDLLWSGPRTDLKMIVIAGNEPFSQGHVHYRQACAAAVTKGIIVNTIHCGSGIPSDWREGALLAEGQAMNIDQNRKAVHIPSPHDDEIARLGIDLNKTYLPFGAHGMESCARQTVQDENALKQSAASIVERSVTKANASYCNPTWDLVDAIRDKKVDLATIKPTDLPEAMRKMSFAEQQAFVEKQACLRKEIQAKINKLQVAREAFLTEKRAALATDTEKTLDAAIVSAIRLQATSKGFSFAANP